MITKRLCVIAVIGSVAVIASAACQASPIQDPAESVESYLQAKVNRDGTTVRRLLCSDLEERYDIEITTFEGVSNARIEGMACRRVGQSDVVTCDGKIVADYGAESNEFPLGSYHVKREDGDWKWCGEAP